MGMGKTGNTWRFAHVGTKLVVQFGLHAFRADDADARNPLPHDGQDMVGVGDGARDDQAAVFQLLDDLLPANEFLAQEVVGYGGATLSTISDFFRFSQMLSSSITFWATSGLGVNVSGATSRRSILLTA